MGGGGSNECSSGGCGHGDSEVATVAVVGVW